MAVNSGNAGTKFNIRSLRSFPQYVEACRKLRDASDEVNTAKSTLEKCTRESVRNAAREDHVAVSVSSRLKGDVTPPYPSCVDLERLNDELRIAREIMFKRKEELDQVEGECVYEILKEVRPQHKLVLTKLLDAVFALSDALQEEDNFVTAMYGAGVSPGGLPTIPHDIRDAVGLRRSWSSGANASARNLEKYLGRPVDYSEVRR